LLLGRADEAIICTDQRRDVEILPANPQPSTHGTKPSTSALQQFVRYPR
jgi:hypothetical protein